MPGSRAEQPSLTVSPDAALLDEAITVRASGLNPGERVTLRTEMEWGDTTYAASARFEATDEGVVSPGDDEPVEGDYEGVHPMGLFWAMGPTDEPTPDRDSIPERLPTTVALRRNGELVDTASVTRRSRRDGVSRRAVDADGVPSDYYRPAGDGPHPGVVVLGGSDGGRPRGVQPWLLASHGYAVLGPAYFGEDGAPADELVEVPVGAVERAVDWFADRESVRAEPLAAIGRSRGSELAFLLGSRLDAVRTVVGVVPSGVAFQGLGENFRAADTAAWAVDGEPVDYVPFEFSLRDVLSNAWSIIRGKPTRMRGAYLDGIDETDPERVEAAEIPVEETGGPVLLLAGEDDELWASDRLARRLEDRLEDAGYDHDVDCRSYPDAGHAIDVPYTPATNRSSAGDGRFKLALGGTPAGYAGADESSWAAILDTLERGLRLDDSQ